MCHMSFSLIGSAMQPTHRQEGGHNEEQQRRVEQDELGQHQRSYL